MNDEMDRMLKVEHKRQNILHNEVTKKVAERRNVMSKVYTMVFQWRKGLITLGVLVLLLASGKQSVSAAAEAYLIKVNRACNTIL